MPVLVTGAAGFVGRAGVDALARRGSAVVAPGVDRPRVDLTDPAAVDSLVAAAGAETLVHAAWYGGDDRIDSPRNADWVRHTGRLVESCLRAGGRRVVTLGTCFEFAFVDGPLQEEHTPLRPHSAYGAAKVAMAADVASRCLEHGAVACHARVGFVYGPGERPPRLVPALVESLLEGRRFAATAGTQRRDYLFVDDVASAVALLAAADVAGAVNVGSGKAIRVAELISAFATEVDALELVDFGARPLRPGDPECIELSVRRLTALGWQAEVPLVEGVRRTVRALAPDRSVVHSEEPPDNV